MDDDDQVLAPADALPEDLLDDPWYWATGVLVGEQGLDFDPDELLRRHEVDRVVSRAVRMEPATALAQAVQAAAPEMPPISPRHIPGLRSQFYDQSYWHVHKARPTVRKVIAARRAGRADTITAADQRTYDQSENLFTGMAAIQFAEPFFLPGSYAAMICESEPPDAEFLADLRLPYPSCAIWFGRPLIHHESVDRDLLVAGVILAQDPATGTGIYDAAMWLFIEFDDTDMWVFPTMVAKWTVLPNAAEVANAAAAIASLPFAEPPDPPAGEPLSSPWRKALKHSQARRAAEAGAITGLRVLDLGRLPTTSRYEPSDEGDYLRSPHGLRPHWRKGHWRRARIAHRDHTGAIVGDVHGAQGADWDYRVDWIKPKRVNARLDAPGPVIDQPRIYRVTPPADPD